MGNPLKTINGDSDGVFTQAVTGKLAGSNSLSHLGTAEPLTHGQQVTLLRTEASTAFTAKRAGNVVVKGARR